MHHRVLRATTAIKENADTPNFFACLHNNINTSYRKQSFMKQHGKDAKIDDLCNVDRIRLHCWKTFDQQSQIKKNIKSYQRKINLACAHFELLRPALMYFLDSIELFY